MMQQIFRANSHYIRLVELEDAEFIHGLRTDRTYNEFLTKVGISLEQQISWIEAYKLDEQAGKQYYFIILDNSNQRIGSVRLYDFDKDTFCWGSWILKNGSSWSASLESMALIYHVGFDVLNFKYCVFNVRKLNVSVFKLHQKLGADVVAEQGLEYILNMPESKARLIINKVLN